MKIPEQKREELVAKAESSQLRPAAKAQVLKLLSQEELTDEEMGKILNAIQNDIEEDFAEVPEVNVALEKDEEYQALVAKQEAELAEIEKEAKESAEFVEAQTKELDAIDADLTKAEDELKLEEVKGKLGMEA